MKLTLLFICMVKLVSASTTSGLDTIKELTQINIDYLDARLQTINSQEDKEIAIYQYFPTISLFASTFESAASFGFATDQIKSQGITARWTVFNFFQDLYKYHAAKNTLKSNESFQRAMLLAAEKSSFEVYLNYLNNYEQYMIKKDITETLDQSAKVAKGKFKRGETSGSESNKIIIQSLNTKNESETFLANSEFYKERILKLLKKKSLKPTWPLSESNIKSKVSQLLKAKASFEQNPNIEKFRFDKKAMEDLVTSQKLRHLGEVNLNYRNQKSNLDGFNDWDTQITLTYTFPIFANNTIQADVVKTKNKLKLAQTKLEQEKAKLRALKKSQKIKIRISFENFKRQLQASKLANTVYQQELRKFKRGLVSVNDLLFEQQRQSQAQLGLITSKNDLLLSLVDFCHLQGKEFKTCL